VQRAAYSAPRLSRRQGVGNRTGFALREAKSREARVSNSDSFIDEVTEEIRRDRMFALLRRYGWIAVLIVVIAVAGAAVYEWRKAVNRAEARAFGDSLLAALEQNAPEARLDALSNIEAEGGAGAVVQFLRAAEAQAAGDTGRALKDLSAIADDNALPSSYRQLALLKQTMLGAGVTPIAARRATMEQLAAPGQAFRPLALEQLALLDLEAGDRGAAIDRLRAILDEPEASPGLRQRASQTIVALGGDLNGN
jgi:hypothetical protein